MGHFHFTATMASITRSLRPVAFHLSAASRRSAAPWRSSQFQGRAFSATPVSQAKRYTKDHEWVEISEDGKTGVIGISDYAGDAIGAVESVKSASDINAPITCTITAVNDLLEEKPGTINKGPEDEGSSGGWVAKVEVGEAGIKGLEELMDAKAYKEFTEDA